MEESDLPEWNTMGTEEIGYKGVHSIFNFVHFAWILINRRIECE